MCIQTRNTMAKLLTCLLCCLICALPAQAGADLLELVHDVQETPAKPEQEPSADEQVVEIVQPESAAQTIPPQGKDAAPETPPARTPQDPAPKQQAEEQVVVVENQVIPVLRFYDEAGLLLYSQPVAQGSVTIAPEEKPDKDGHLFFYWYEQNEEEVVPFVFGFPLERDVALMPHYIAIEDVLETGELVFSIDEEVTNLLPETDREEKERCVMTREQADDLISEILDAMFDKEMEENAAEAPADAPAPGQEADDTETESLPEEPVFLPPQGDGEDTPSVPEHEEIAAQILTLAKEEDPLPQADSELSDEARNETDSVLNEDGVHVIIAELTAGMSDAEAEDAQAEASNPLSGIEISIGLSQSPDGTPFPKGSEITEGQRVYLVASILNPENHAFTMQWQRDAGSGWTSIPGETGLAYGYEVTAQNVHWNYRLQLIPQQ